MEVELRDGVIKNLNKEVEELKRQIRSKDKEINRLKLEVEELDRYYSARKKS